MQKAMLYHIGKFIYYFRWPIIGIWMLIIAASVYLLFNFAPLFKTTGFVDEQSISVKAGEHINKSLGYLDTNKLIITYHSKKTLNKASRLKAIKDSLDKLEDFPIEHEIIYPYSENQISKDKRTFYAVVIIKSTEPLSDKLLKQFKAAIKIPSDMTIEFGGEPFFVENVNHQTQKDLLKADLIATPIALITMVIVFGSLIAAFIPIILGGGCAVVILITLFIFSHYFTLSIFTLNIALLLGLCLCLDYSLFIISRFRDELENGLDAREAIAVMQSTAGKAVFYSGTAVFVSLSALFLFPINILFSMAVGGLTAVFYAVFFSIVLLPAVLSVLGKRINYLSVRRIRKHEEIRSSSWHWLAKTVVRRPFSFFFLILIILLSLGYPFLSVKFGVSDYKIFPKDSASRSFYDMYAKQFDENELTPIIISVETAEKSILSRQNINKLYDFARQLQKNPLVADVNSIVTTDPDLGKAQYYGLYKTQKNKSPIKELLNSSTSQQLTTMTIISKYPLNSPETKKLIDNLQKIKINSGLKISLAGTPVNNADLLKSIYKTLPYAILWIMVFSYLILLLLLRSIFLPFKAIVFNLLSLAACYGALVLVFQEGYFAHYLNFEPQGVLDISLLVIIFCALFGFSMDYEVFLLSRIKEDYIKTGDNKKSIIFGIEKSSRIITSAALIVIVLCGSFLVADVLMVKQFGLGIAVAIFVDAFLIRTLLVPSTMTIFEKWNWYLPKWLDKILPKF